jgi:hypothetical protein
MQWKHKVLNYLLLAGLLFSGALLCLNYFYLTSFTILISASAFLLAFAVSLLLVNRTALKLEEQYELFFKEGLLECRHSANSTEQVKWKELSQVSVISTDKGPYEPYLWVSLNDLNGNALMFPLGAKNSKEVLEKILGLDGFDLKLWSLAMSSTENKKFLVWNSPVRIS